MEKTLHMVIKLVVFYRISIIQVAHVEFKNRLLRTSRCKNLIDLIGT